MCWAIATCPYKLKVAYQPVYKAALLCRHHKNDFDKDWEILVRRGTQSNCTRQEQDDLKIHYNHLCRQNLNGRRAADVMNECKRSVVPYWMETV